MSCADLPRLYTASMNRALTTASTYRAPVAAHFHSGAQFM
jgi:hypothetical protein